MYEQENKSLMLSQVDCDDAVVAGSRPDFWLCLENGKFPQVFFVLFCSLAV